MVFLKSIFIRLINGNEGRFFRQLLIAGLGVVVFLVLPVCSYRVYFIKGWEDYPELIIEIVSIVPGVDYHSFF